MLRKRVRRIGAALLPVTLIGIVAVVAVSNAQSVPGCEPVDIAIQEPGAFEVVTQRLTSFPDPPIAVVGVALPEVVPDDVRVDSIDGLPFRWIALGANGAAYQYFLESPLPATMRVSDFFKAGGIQLDRDPSDGNGSFAEHLLATSGDRAVRVEVGEHVGALIWADPDASGQRLHHLYWTSSGFNYALYGNRTAEEILTLGRELACGPLP